MEHIGSDTRAYHTLTSRFVWGEPDVSYSGMFDSRLGLGLGLGLGLEFALT